MLHDCSKIQRFEIKYDNNLGSDPEVTSKIRFAIRKRVEVLSLHLYPLGSGNKLDRTFSLPKFLFSNALLVKLELFRCYFSEDQSANWPNLKEFWLDCSHLYHSYFGNILAGCPVLAFLEITNWRWLPGSVIASKSLKKLSFVYFQTYRKNGHFGISCPNLEELSSKIHGYHGRSMTNLSGKTINSVLSSCPLLHKLVLFGLGDSDRLVIASKSLKMLVLGRIYGILDLEITCPCLEVFNLYHCAVGSVNYELIEEWKCVAMKILDQIKHVKVLDIGSWLIQTLKAENGSSSLYLKCKCLTLDGAYSDGHLPGIVSAISCLPFLEKLDIKFPMHKFRETEASPSLNNCRNMYCSRSDGAVLDCSVLNLKTVKFFGLSERYGNSKCVFNFIEFLLKNGRVLEKIVVVLADSGERFRFEVSQKLLSLPRGCSPMATMELCSTCPNM